jgi:hypothetical protein
LAGCRLDQICLTAEQSLKRRYTMLSNAQITGKTLFFEKST